MRAGRVRHIVPIAPLLIAIGFGAWSTLRHPHSQQRPIETIGADSLPDLVILEPGTIVDEGPPPGWTDLVVKSVPRLASGELGRLPASAGPIATLFRTAVVAEVRGDQRGEIFLNRIGVGICIPHNGHDTVVTSSSLSDQKVKLSPLNRLVLALAEGELGKGELAARTSTFALFSTPAVLVIDGSHRDVLLRYAILCDTNARSIRTCAGGSIATRPAEGRLKMSSSSRPPWSSTAPWMSPSDDRSGRCPSPGRSRCLPCPPASRSPSRRIFGPSPQPIRRLRPRSIVSKRGSGGC